MTVGLPTEPSAHRPRVAQLREADLLVLTGLATGEALTGLLTLTALAPA